MNPLTIVDWILFPLYFIVLYVIAIRMAKKQATPQLSKYYLSSFLLHAFGSLLFSIVVVYYYGYGDAYTYYYGGEFIRSAGAETGKTIDLFFMSGKNLFDFSTPFELNDWSRNGMQASGTLSVEKISGILSFFSCKSFLVISLFMGLFSFAGQWKLFVTFNGILKSESQKYLAYGILYTPTIWFWGSGLGKDSLCLGALGFLTYFVYDIFFKGRTTLKNFAGATVFFIMLYFIKSYIAAAFIAAFGLAGVIELVRRRKSLAGKLVTGVALFLVIMGFFFISFYSYLNATIQDSAETIEISKRSYADANAEDDRSLGSFDAKEIDISIGGFIKESPMKIFSTLFRPFVWEARKPIMLLSALESLAMFLAFLYILYLCKVTRFFSLLFSDSMIMFSFMMTIILALMVGFTTFNFGTLVRYRLPLIPFFFFMLLAMYNKVKPRLVKARA